jgi:hypothetical protein
MESFRMRLDEIQPSQLYINREKLETVMGMIERGQSSSLGPIPNKELDGEIIATDGHTRAFALHLKGAEEVDVEWEDLEWDWDAYRVCVAWCKEEGIRSMADLADRIIDSADYQVLWLERCRVMQEELEEKRKLGKPN